MEDYKYLVDGRAVLVEQEIDGGFIVQRVYDPDEDSEPVYGDSFFVRKVYDCAPTEKMDAAIVRLKSSIDEYQKQINELQKEKSSIEAFVRSSKVTTNLRMVFKYLTGDFKWVVFQRNLDKYHADKVYTSSTRITVTLKDGEVMLFEPNSEGRRVSVFDTEDEAIQFAERELTHRIGVCENLYRLDELEKDYSMKWLTEKEFAVKLFAERRIALSEKDKAQEIQNAIDAFAKAKDTLTKHGITV